MSQLLNSLVPLNDAVEIKLWFFIVVCPPLGSYREAWTGEWLSSSFSREVPLMSVYFFIPKSTKNVDGCLESFL